MTTPDLHLELADPKAVHQPGDEVSGHVVLRSGAELRWDEVEVELVWSTHGWGKRNEGEPQTVRFSDASRTARRQAFSFRLPGGPVTYRGHLVNVGWFLRVRTGPLDRGPLVKGPTSTGPRRRTVVAEQEITLVTGSAPGRQADWREQFVEGLAGSHQADRERAAGRDTVRAAEQAGAGPGGSAEAGAGAGRSGGGIGLLAARVAILLVVVGMVAGALLWAADGVRNALDGEWTNGLFAAGLLTILAVAGVVARIRDGVLAGRVGAIEGEVDVWLRAPGEEVVVRVHFTPRRETLLRRATARLVGFERSVASAGTERITSRHELHQETVVLAEDRRLPAGHPVLLEATFRVPETAPPSFVSLHNAVRWEVAAEVELAALPDWKGSFDVVVTPGDGGGDRLE